MNREGYRAGDRKLRKILAEIAERERTLAELGLIPFDASGEVQDRLDRMILLCTHNQAQLDALERVVSQLEAEHKRREHGEGPRVT
jgi:hypothetical protein